MEIDGLIEAIIFSNENNGYKVLKLDTTDGNITAVGIIPNVIEGDSIRISGELIYHDKYGEKNYNYFYNCYDS